MCDASYGSQDRARFESKHSWSGTVARAWRGRHGSAKAAMGGQGPLKGGGAAFGGAAARHTAAVRRCSWTRPRSPRTSALHDEVGLVRAQLATEGHQPPRRESSGCPLPRDTCGACHSRTPLSRHKPRGAHSVANCLGTPSPPTPRASRAPPPAAAADVLLAAPGP